MNTNNEEKRGPGRPRQGEGKAHIDLSLSKEVIAFLRSMPSGVRSKFVDDLIKDHPEYILFKDMEQ